ncbi:MAG: VWA domain-containing protein [Alphaproteobacteria bacterium]|nr:MAG: VWA domain-containing protein [Alphaproteobacteria bacterium]
MSEAAALPIPAEGRLAENILHFARALRRAGLKVGPGRVVEAVRAVEAVGFSERIDFYATLRACFVSRPEELELFHQVFNLYWRDPRFLEQMMAAMLPSVRGGRAERDPQAAERRAAEALLGEAAAPAPELPEAEEGEEVEFQTTLSFSAAEELKTRDFEQMTAEEAAAARRMIATLALPVEPIATRRHRPDPRGRRPDWRATLRRARRRGGEVDRLCWQRPAERWPDLVAICDISGSMAGYSRMLLHFLHAAAHARGAGWARVHAFTFGTRLTNITRPLMRRDPDAALAAVGRLARDWEGGTRIGPAIAAFNRDWSRRVLARGAVVLLITDGLDRAAPDEGAAAADLGREMERLRLSSRKLIWLNPLLRFEGFAAKASGIRAMLPHVDSFRPCHSVASLEALAEALTRPEDRGERDRLLAGMAAEG